MTECPRQGKSRGIVVRIHCALYRIAKGADGKGESYSQMDGTGESRSRAIGGKGVEATAGETRIAKVLGVMVGWLAGLQGPR